MGLSKLFFAFLCSMGASLLLTPIVRYVAEKNSLVAAPKEDRWHTRPTALLGGIAMFAAFCISFSIFAEHTKAFWEILTVFTLMFILGLVDDIYHLRPYTKLAGQIIISCIFVYFGFHLHIGGPAIGVPLTILWIVGIVNAFNLLDNMDGLSAGIAFISSAFLCLRSIVVGAESVALMSTIVAGAAGGFLFFNFNPAKIFMGDCGSHFLGFALATSAIIGASGHASNLFMTLSVPLTLLCVPIFDTLFVTFMRQMHSRSIVQGGKDHTSHRLVALGLSEKKAVLVLYAISIMAGILVSVNTRFNVFALFTFIGFLSIVLFFFGMFLGEVKIYSEEEAKKARQKSNGNVILNGLIMHKRRIAEMVVDFLTICIAYTSSYLLRYEGVISEENAQLLMASLPIVIGIKLSVFIYSGLYRGVWRYVSLRDIMSIFKAVTIGSVLSVVALVYLFRFQGYSRTAFIIDWIVLFVLASGTRTTLRMMREVFSSMASRKNKRKVLIAGAGDAGELLLRELKTNQKLNYLPVGFLDDDIKKQGKRIHGVSVLGTTSDIVRVAAQEGVEEVIVAIHAIEQKKLWYMFDECRKNNIDIKNTSSFSYSLVNGQDFPSEDFAYTESEGASVMEDANPHR